VVADRPKVLADVRGRPFLAHLLDQLAVDGFNDVVVCTGYLGEQVQEFFGSTYKNLHLVYSRESVAMGTGGALRLARPFLKSDPILAMNGDSFVQTSLHDFVTWHSRRQAVASVLLVTHEEGDRYGQVEVDEEGKILRFSEKGSRRGVGWINAGIYLLAQSVLRAIPVSCPTSLEKDVLPFLVGAGLYGYRAVGRFLDIGTPESYAAAEDFFALRSRL
jgi:NDP-sugar pyrophosphorylase family protein